MGELLNRGDFFIKNYEKNGSEKRKEEIVKNIFKRCFLSVSSEQNAQEALNCFICELDENNIKREFAIPLIPGIIQDFRGVFLEKDYQIIIKCLDRFFEFAKINNQSANEIAKAIQA